MKLINLDEAADMAQTQVDNAARFHRQMVSGCYDHSDILEAKEDLDKAIEWRRRVEIMKDKLAEKK